MTQSGTMVQTPAIVTNQTMNNTGVYGGGAYGQYGQYNMGVGQINTYNNVSGSGANYGMGYSGYGVPLGGSNV